MSGRWHAALPAFENVSQLHAAPSWERYLTAVYGMPLVYPVRLRTFSFFRSTNWRRQQEGVTLRESTFHRGAPYDQGPCDGDTRISQR